MKILRSAPSSLSRFQSLQHTMNGINNYKIIVKATAASVDVVMKASPAAMLEALVIGQLLICGSRGITGPRIFRAQIEEFTRHLHVGSSSWNCNGTELMTASSKRHCSDVVGQESVEEERKRCKL